VQRRWILPGSCAGGVAILLHDGARLIGEFVPMPAV
jgi:hypothetical protein